MKKASLFKPLTRTIIMDFPIARLIKILNLKAFTTVVLILGALLEVKSQEGDSEGVLTGELKTWQ